MGLTHSQNFVMLQSQYLKEEAICCVGFPKIYTEMLNCNTVWCTHQMDSKLHLSGQCMPVVCDGIWCRSLQDPSQN